MSYQVIHAEVLAWAKEYKQRIERGEAEPFHALCCDPPWEYHFMSKGWDNTGITFQPETWATLAAVLHPGAFLFVFAGSRGWHRLACAMEDAGLVLQPSIFVWGLGVVEVPLLFGHLQAQAFPKASRIDTKIDKAAGKLEERKIIGSKRSGLNMNTNLNDDNWHKIGSGEEGKHLDITAPATPLARAWEGHRYGGQVLKDALTPIIVAQKPWEGKRLDCIVHTGAGAINVEAGRVKTNDNLNGGTYSSGGKSGPMPGDIREGAALGMFQPGAKPNYPYQQPIGRWPANFCLVHRAPSAPDGSGGCVRAGTKRVKSESYRPESGHGAGKTASSIAMMGDIDNRSHFSGSNYADPDGYEVVDAWRCAEGCPARRLGEMSGERGGKWGRQGKCDESVMPFSETKKGTDYLQRSEQYKGDRGTAARFYHQSGWEHERAEMRCARDPETGEPLCPVAKLDEQAGERKSGRLDSSHQNKSIWGGDSNREGIFEASSGGASRFYAQADWEHERAEMRCCQDCPVFKLDEQAGESNSSYRDGNRATWEEGSVPYGKKTRGEGRNESGLGYNDEGGRSRYFHQSDWHHEIAERLATSDPVRYCPKAAKSERSKGLDDFYWRKDKASPTGFVRISEEEWEALGEEEQRVKEQTGKRVSLRARGNVHVAVKPISLCEWLCRLLSPPPEYAPRRLVIPFSGSGSELCAAIVSGCFEEVVAIDYIEDHCAIAEARAAFWSAQPRQLELT